MILCLYYSIIGGALHVHNMFQPLQNKVQSLRKAQNLLPKFVPVLTQRHKQERPTSPWRFLRKYLADRCPFEPLFCPECTGQAWKQPQKCVLVMPWDCHGMGELSPLLQGVMIPQKKKYFHSFIFYFIILFATHDGWIQQERQSSLETDLSAAK